MKTFFKSVASAAALTVGLTASAAVSAETTLIVGTWQPPGNPMNSVVWPTWAEWVEEATEGRVKVKIEQDVGHPKTYFQLVEDGVINAGWSYHGYGPGRFKLPVAVELPGLNVSAEAASVALWKTQEKYFAEAGEYEGLTLLATLIRMKPSTAKGTYLKSIALSSTMGPGVKIDTVEAQRLSDGH